MTSEEAWAGASVPFHMLCSALRKNGFFVMDKLNDLNRQNISVKINA